MSDSSKVVVAKWRLLDICFVTFQHTDTWLLWFISWRRITLIFKGPLKDFMIVLFGNTRFWSIEMGTFLPPWFLYCGNRNRSALRAFGSLWSSFCSLASGPTFWTQHPSNGCCACNFSSLPFICPPLMYIRLPPSFCCLSFLPQFSRSHDPLVLKSFLPLLPMEWEPGYLCAYF